MSVKATETVGRKVLVMTAGGLNPSIVVQHLVRSGLDVEVILEQPEGKGEITRRRAKRLGWIKALGQLGTMMAARACDAWPTAVSQNWFKDMALTGACPTPSRSIQSPRSTHRKRQRSSMN